MPKLPLTSVKPAAVPFTLKLQICKGDPTNHGRFTNDFLFATEHRLGDPALSDMALALGTRIAQDSHESTRYLRAIWGPQPRRGSTKGNRTQYERVAIGLVGSRVAEATSPGASLDDCVTFEKSAGPGTAGQIKMRGLLALNEVSVNKAYRPDFVGGHNPAWCDQLCLDIAAIFESHACCLILPAADNNHFATEWRPVTNFSVVGIQQRQLRNHRKSVLQKEKDAFDAEVSQLKKQAESAFEGFGGSEVAGAIKAAVDAMRSEVGQMIIRYGIARIAASLTGTGAAITILREVLQLLSGHN